MQVEVRLFAAAAEAVGCRHLRLEVDENSTGRDVLRRLAEQYPNLRRLERALRIAVNEEYVSPDRRLAAGDVLVLIPPVSGGSEVAAADPYVRVTDTALSVDGMLARVVHPTTGAAVLFVGTVREITGDRTTSYLHYEAYREMAEREMRDIAAELQAEYPGLRVAMAHRTGDLHPGEASVVVAVASPHRPAAFEAGRLGIDRLKERVPIWKKEVWADGEEWVGLPWDEAANER